MIAELIRKAEEEAGLQPGRLAGDGSGARPVKVRVGRYPTFTRVVFEWDEPTDTVLSRENDSVVVSFSRPSEIDLSRLIADPPPLLTGATARRDKDKLIVTLAVETGTDVRGFREGNTYIVDLAEDTPTADLTGNSPFDGGLFKFTIWFSKDR